MPTYLLTPVGPRHRWPEASTPCPSAWSSRARHPCPRSKRSEASPLGENSGVPAVSNKDYFKLGVRSSYLVDVHVVVLFQALFLLLFKYIFLFECSFLVHGSHSAAISREGITTLKSNRTNRGFGPKQNLNPKNRNLRRHGRTRRYTSRFPATEVLVAWLAGV